MATEAQLIARVEARLDSFEKQMKRAGVIADNAVRDIEDKFKKANPQVNDSFFSGLTSKIVKGNLITEVIKEAAKEAFKEVEKLIERMKDLERTATLTGQSVEEVFAKQSITGMANETNKALEGIAKSFSRLQRGEETNSLNEILKLEGKTISDLDSVGQAFDIVAKNVATSTSLITALEKGESLGWSREYVEALVKIGHGYDEMSKKANDAIPQFKKIKEAADEIERAWTGALTAVKELFEDIVASDFGQAIIKGLLAGLREVAAIVRAIQSAINNLSGGNFAENTARGLGRGLTVLPAGAKLKDENEPSADLPIKTAKATKERLDSVERLVIEQRALARETEKELQLVGQTKAKRDEELIVLRLIEAVEKDKARGIEHNTELLAKQEEELRKLAKRAAEARAEMDQINFVLSSMKSIATDALKGFVADLQAGHTAAEALRNSLNRIAERLLDKSLDVAMNVLFTGSIAGGAGAGSGGLNAIIGNALQGFFGGNRMAGGQVSGGKFYMVGEGGPELVSFGRNGVVMPNMAAMGGGSPGFSVVIENHSKASVDTQAPQRRSDGVWEMRQFIRSEIDERIGTPGTGANRSLRTMGAKLPLTAR